MCTSPTLCRRTAFFTATSNWPTLSWCAKKSFPVHSDAHCAIGAHRFSWPVDFEYATPDANASTLVESVPNRELRDGQPYSTLEVNRHSIALRCSVTCAPAEGFGRCADSGLPCAFWLAGARSRVRESAAAVHAPAQQPSFMLFVECVFCTIFSAPGLLCRSHLFRR